MSGLLFNQLKPSRPKTGFSKKKKFCLKTAALTAPDSFQPAGWLYQFRLANRVI